MKTSTFLLLPILLIPIATFAIYATATSESDPLITNTKSYQPNAEWNAYWYEGKAELTSYKLNQARYGEMHEGTAMLMFVTEDFSPKAHTKANGDAATKLPVLKMNFEKKFVTGIYPYSLLCTAASPTDIQKHPNPITVATSVQEWCGHTFTQFNLVGKQYAVTEHSYFPGEGDQALNLPAVMCEDALWTRLRIAPDQLPVGEFDLIPGGFYLRLRHQKIEARKAKASLSEADAQGLRQYKVNYADGSRELVIHFTAAFPYTIESWTETYQEGFGAAAKPFTTTATKIVRKKLAYWDMHGNADRAVRTEMGLD